MTKFKILVNDKIAGLGRRLGIGYYETDNAEEIRVLKSSPVAVEIKPDPVIEEIKDKSVPTEKEVNPVGQHNNATRRDDLSKHKRV